MIRNVLTPRNALLVLIGALLLRLAVLAGHEFSTIVRNPDSAEYEAVSRIDVPVDVRLVSPRPPVYPAFLALARTFGSDYQALPFLQFGVFAAAVVFLFLSTRSAGFAPWESLLLTIPLAGASIIRDYGSHLMPEVIVASLGLCALGATLRIAAKGPTARRRALLSLFIAAAVLTKPAFLFLVPLAPIAIAVIRPSFRKEPARGHFRELAATAAWIATPLLLYSFIRLAVVGSFGIVSYGGIALAGLGTNPVLLKSSDVASLSSQEMQNLARAILARRTEAAALNQSTREFPEYVFDTAGLSAQPRLDAWSRAFDPSIFVVALPAARKFYGVSTAPLLNPDWVLVNRKLGALSAETLKLKKGLYLRWAYYSIRTGFRSVFMYEKGGRILIAIAFIALVGGVLWRGAIYPVLKGRTRASDVARPLGYGVLGAGTLLVFGRESVFDFANNVRVMTSDVVLQFIFPVIVISISVIVTLAGFFGWLRSKSSDRIAGPAVAYAALAGAYFASAMILVGLIEMPLERYVEAVSPVLPGAALLVSVKAAVGLWRGNAEG